MAFRAIAQRRQFLTRDRIREAIKCILEGIDPRGLLEEKKNGSARRH